MLRPAVVVAGSAVLALLTALVVSVVDPTAAAAPAPAPVPSTAGRDGGPQLEAETRALRELADREIGTALKGRRVLVVTTPDVSLDAVGRLTDVLADADAVVSGTVALTAEYGSAARGNELEDVAVGLVPPRTSLPRTRTASTVAAAILARSLVAPSARAAGDVADDAAALLAGLADAGFVSVDGRPQNGATLAVVLSDGTPTPGANGSRARDQAVVDLVAALDARSAGAVLASVDRRSGRAMDGDVAGAVAAVRAVRAATKGKGPTPAPAKGKRDPAVTGVSTVDGAGTTAGAVTVVLALREQVARKAGDYGRGTGATALLPPPPGGVAP